MASSKRALSLDSELEHRPRLVLLAGLQIGRRKVRLVRGIGILLRLHAEAAPMRVHGAPFALERPVKEIAHVKLHSGFFSRDLERPSALGFDDARRELKSAAR